MQPRLAAGDQPRFLTDVARKLGRAGEAVASVKPNAPALPKATGQSSADAPAPADKSGHPAGDRAKKRHSAIADNLKKWLAARKPQD